MSKEVKAIPDGYHTVTPSLVIDGAAKAIDFYKKAFAAEEIMRILVPGGKIMHGEIRIGNSRVMVADEMPEMNCKSPITLGGSPVAFYVYIEDVDAAWKRAVDAGATPAMPPNNMFWGDRVGVVNDPFGHRWTLAQRVSDPTQQEMKQGQEAFVKKMQNKA